MKLRAEFKESIKRAITTWDMEHPIDVLWRQEFKVPFLSKTHLSYNFIAQQAWYEEYQAIEAIQKKAQDDYERKLFGDDENKENERVKDIESNEVTRTNTEIDEAFDNLDLTQYETQEEKTPTKSEQIATLQTLIETSKISDNG